MEYAKRIAGLGLKASNEWCILTALRGPDNGDRKLKANTTEGLRYLLFGHNVAAVVDCCCHLLDLDNPYITASERTGAWEHFSKHFEDALCALSHCESVLAPLCPRCILYNAWCYLYSNNREGASILRELIDKTDHLDR